MPSAAKGKVAPVATKSAAATPESIAAAMVKTVRDNNHIPPYDALTVVSTEQEKEAIQRFFTEAQTAADESVSGTTALNVLFGGRA